MALIDFAVMGIAFNSAALSREGIVPVSRYRDIWKQTDLYAILGCKFLVSFRLRKTLYRTHLGMS